MKTLLWKIAFVALALIAIAGAAAAYYNEGMVIDTDNLSVGMVQFQPELLAL